jgi:mannosyltransferase
VTRILDRPTIGSRRDPTEPRDARPAVVAILLGIIGTVSATLFSWVPSVWYDEDATITSATRSLSGLWREIHTVDAVHAAYYVAMHFWFDLVPYSPWSLRFPSAVALGVAVCFTALIGARLLGLTTGIVAGMVLCVLPRAMWAGLEGRSYAATAAVVAVLTFTLLVAITRLRSGRRSWPFWVAYLVIGVLGIYLFIYVALSVFAHVVLVTVLAARNRDRASLSTAAGLAAVVVVVFAAALPVILLSSKERTQVGWIPALSPASFRVAFADQWFWGNIPFAIAGWVLILLGVLFATDRVERRLDEPGLLLVAGLGAFLPMAALIVVTAVSTPLYLDRYLTPTTPFVALLMAAGIVGLPWRWSSMMAGAVVLLLGGVVYVGLRAPDAKDGAQWQEIAAAVETGRASEPRGSYDVAVYGALPKRTAVTTRLIANAYPSAFSGMGDLTLAKTATEKGTLWDDAVPLGERISKLGTADFVWVVGSHAAHSASEATPLLVKEGFTIDLRETVGGADILRFARR